MFRVSALKHFFDCTLNVSEDITRIIIRFRIDEMDECCVGFAVNITTGECESKP